MKQYSPYFTTVFDGEHHPDRRHIRYSILRTPLWPRAKDVAVIWDHDNDERVIYILERLAMGGYIADVIAIAEYKAHVYVWIRSGIEAVDMQAIADIASDPGDGDVFSAWIAWDDDEWSDGSGHNWDSPGGPQTAPLHEMLCVGRMGPGAESLCFLRALRVMWRLGSTVEIDPDVRVRNE